MTEKRALAKSKSIARARQEGAEANTPCYALAPRQIVYTNCLATPERNAPSGRHRGPHTALASRGLWAAMAIGLLAISTRHRERQNVAQLLQAVHGSPMPGIAGVTCQEGI